MLPLSPEPMRSSTGNSIESVEQPWSMDDGADPSYRLQCAKILEPLVRGYTWS